MKIKDCFRHGDVILIPKPLPENAKEKKFEGDVTLAYGEVTGHSHRISEGVAGVFEFDDKAYLKIQSELATLSHEEHKALQIPQGEYEIIIQKDYTPDGWKKVQD